MSSPDRPTPYQYEPTLEVPGANFHLRLASLNDAELLATASREGGEALAQFVPQARDWTTTEGAQELLRITEELMRAGNSMRYYTVDGQPEGEGPLFGSVALRNHTPGERTAMLGMWAVPAYQKRGLIKPAATIVMNYAAREDVWGLRTVYAKASPDNRPSERVLDGLGFELLSEKPFRDEESFAQTGVLQMVKMWRKQL